MFDTRYKPPSYWGLEFSMHPAYLGTPYSSHTRAYMGLRWPEMFHLEGYITVRMPRWRFQVPYFGNGTW